MGYALVACLGISCAGYQLGNIPYQELEGVETIYVPVVHNETLEPGIQVMTTNAILRRMDQDGTYRSGRVRESDATLEVKITEFERDARQRARRNELVSEQFRIRLKAQVTLLNHRTGQKFLDNASFSGESEYYVPQNRMQEAERQYIVLAAQDLADNIVRHITEGW